MHPMRRRKAIRRITWFGVWGNITLAAVKLVAGVVGSSQALIADAVHSLTDLVSDAAILIGVRFWSEPPDESHHYGHGRIETLVTLGIGLLLAAVALKIGYDGLSALWSGQRDQPEAIALTAAVASILVKEALYHWTLSVAHKTESAALLANAWHHRSDALSSLPVALAVGGAMIKPEAAFLDSLAAAVVGAFILHVAWKVCRPALVELSDASAPLRIQRSMPSLAKEIEGVEGIHAVRTRRFGSEIMVDLHAVVSRELTVAEAHDLCDGLRLKILEEVPEVSEVLIHIDPEEPSETSPTPKSPNEGSGPDDPGE